MPSSLRSQLETLLFLSPQPLPLKRCIEFTHAKKADIESEMIALIEEYARSERGIQILHQSGEYQMVTNGDNRELSEQFVRDTLTAELTRPSLETLSIIAYRGPVTKMELEMIRGVNCSLILRNLAMRGLVQSKEDRKRQETTYEVTLEFLRHLGLQEITELPDYDRLHRNELLEQFLARQRAV